MKKYLAVLFVLLLLPSFAGCKKNDPTVQTSAAVQSSGQSSDVVVWGEVKYNKEYQISLDFPAKVENVLVKEGDVVNIGSPLVTLSTDDYQKNIKKLQTQVNSTKAAINNVDQAALEADIAVLKNQIAYKTEELNNGSKPELQLLQNTLFLAQKEGKQAQDDLKKYQKLLNDGVMSKSDYDKYSDTLDQKVKAVKDAQDNLSKTKRTLQEELDTLNTSVKSKEVQLSQQKDSVTNAQTDLDLMNEKTKKPYLSGNKVISNVSSGIVKEIDVVNGTIIGGQTAQKVIDLIDADSIYVSAEVPEEFLAQISANSKVYIVPSSNKDLKISGHIIMIPNQAVEKDGDRIVKVQVKPDEKSDFIKPGLTSDVHFSRESNIKGMKVKSN